MSSNERTGIQVNKVTFAPNAFEFFLFDNERGLNACQLLTKRIHLSLLSDEVRHPLSSCFFSFYFPSFFRFV